MAKRRTQVSLGGTLGTHEKILKSYIALCLEIGITNVTLAKVAKHARMGFSTVRYNFNEAGRNLEIEAALYASQCGQTFTQLSLEKARSAKNFHPLKAYIDTTFDWLEQDEANARFHLYFYYLSSTKVELPIRHEHMLQTSRLRVLSLLHESIGSKLIPPVEEPANLAEKIYTIIFGCAVLAMSVSTTHELHQQRVKCWEIVGQLVGTEDAKARTASRRN